MSKKRNVLFVGSLALFSFALASCTSGKGEDKSSAASSQEGGGSSSETIDMNKFPRYVENTDNLSYSFEEEEKTAPYFLGNVIYNETAMMTKRSDGSIYAALRYKPKKVLSVRDYTWKTEYPSSSYRVDENKIVVEEGSAIPYWTESQLVGEDLPSPYVKKDSMSLSNIATDYYVWSGVAVYTESDIYYGRQIQVSYVYDTADLREDARQECVLDSLPNVKSKLEGGQDLKIVTVGDSVGEGCSSSYKFNHEPYMHPWADQICDVLKSKYNVSVTNSNQSVGGKQSSYTSEDDSKLADIAKESPDLLFVHYGINDLGANRTPNGFKENIERIVLYVQSALPNCDIVLLSPIMPNPYIYSSDTMEMYCESLQEIAENNTTDSQGVVFLNMTKLSLDYLENGKSYFDLTANGINHPNDYGHRLYTQLIASALVKADLWKKDVR